jgi:hypothetical protein
VRQGEAIGGCVVALFMTKHKPLESNDDIFFEEACKCFKVIFP